MIRLTRWVAEVFEKDRHCEEQTAGFIVCSSQYDKSLKSAKLKKCEKHSPFCWRLSLEDTYDLFLQIDSMDKVCKDCRMRIEIVGFGHLEEDWKRRLPEKPTPQNFSPALFEHKISFIINKAISLLTTKFDGDAIAVREAYFWKARDCHRQQLVRSVSDTGFTMKWLIEMLKNWLTRAIGKNRQTDDADYHGFWCLWRECFQISCVTKKK